MMARRLKKKKLADLSVSSRMATHVEGGRLAGCAWLCAPQPSEDPASQEHSDQQWWKTHHQNHQQQDCQAAYKDASEHEHRCEGE
jgi:hypothetical protein